MLIGQNCRRHQYRGLHTVCHTFEQCPRGDLGLAKAHISAKQTIHRKRLFHVLLDFLDRAQLIAGFLIGEGILKLLLPDRILTEAVPRFHAPRRVQIDQILCHDRDRGLGLRLRRLPFTAGQLVDTRRAAVRTDVFLHDIHLLHRNVQHIVARVFDFDIVLLFPLHRKLFNADKLTDAMVLMHDEIALAHIGEGLQLLSFILVFFASGLFTCFKDIAFADIADLLRRKVDARSQTSLREVQFFQKTDPLRELAQILQPFL